MDIVDIFATSSNSAFECFHSDKGISKRYTLCSDTNKLSQFLKLKKKRRTLMVYIFRIEYFVASTKDKGFFVKKKKEILFHDFFLTVEHACNVYALSKITNFLIAGLTINLFPSFFFRATFS